MNLNHHTQIAIVGLGLLGGSIAKGLHQAGFRILGVDIDPAAVEYGIETGWISAGSTDPEIVKDADIIISALYPHVFVEWVHQNQKYFKTGTLLTDVTGVKRTVIKEINEFLRGDIEFIAAHPMAGREFKGIRYADSGRFLTANFIIVPTEQNTEEAIASVREIARILNFANIATLTPEEHDHMIAFLSQLTHVIAVSLMNVKDNSSLAEYTGDSFRDLTRIARINEDLWPELFVMNKDYLIEEIDAFTAEMQAFRSLIETEDFNGMREKLIQSTQRRAVFDKK